MIKQRDPLFSVPVVRGAVAVSVAFAAMLGAGCSDLATDVGLGSRAPATVQAKVERIDPVTQSGRKAAVLSLHMRKSYQDACKYGLTLTNNLPEKITNLTFRFQAYIQGGVAYQAQTKNFYEIRPTEHQYREMTFQQVSCDQIERLEVTDPGRCAVAEMNRYSSNPGDCKKFTDIASSSLARIAWK